MYVMCMYRMCVFRGLERVSWLLEVEGQLLVSHPVAASNQIWFLSNTLLTAEPCVVPALTDSV